MIHVDDAICYISREIDFMSDDNHRHSFIGKPTNGLQHRSNELGVERAGWLIEENHLRLHR